MATSKKKTSKKKTAAKKAASKTANVSTESESKPVDPESTIIHETAPDGSNLNKRDPASLRPSGPANPIGKITPERITHPDHPDAALGDDPIESTEEAEPATVVQDDIQEEAHEVQLTESELDEQMAEAVDQLDEEIAAPIQDEFDAFADAANKQLADIRGIGKQRAFSVHLSGQVLFVPLAKGGFAGLFVEFEEIGDEHPGTASRRRKEIDPAVKLLAFGGYQVAKAHGVADGEDIVNRYLSQEDTPLNRL